MSAARSRSTRSGCARCASGWSRRRSGSPAPPRSRDILATLDQPNAPALLIVDSIQTMWIDGLEQAPGTVTQLRAAAQALIRIAKQRGSALMLVGHVTKDGQIAGPRVLEHMVDAVLYFEGERGHQFRILRAVKNRFGPANEIGVFEMAEAGLVRGAQPVGPVPGRPRGGRRRRRGVRRHGGHAAAAGRDPGTGGAERPRRRRGAPWSAGTAAGWPCCSPCWRPAAGL